MQTARKLTPAELDHSLLVRLVRSWSPMATTDGAYSSPGQVADYADHLAEIHKAYSDFMTGRLQEIEDSRYGGYGRGRGGGARSAQFADLMSDAHDDCIQSRAQILENAKWANATGDE